MCGERREREGETSDERREMNRLLYGDGGRPQSLPDTVEEKLSGRGVARRLRFNAFGTLLAVGTADGAVVLWDFGTRAVRGE